MARKKTERGVRFDTVINLRVDQTLHQEAHDISKRLDLPVSHIGRIALQEFIDRNRSRKSLFETNSEVSDN